MIVRRLPPFVVLALPVLLGGCFAREGGSSRAKSISAPK